MEHFISNAAETRREVEAHCGLLPPQPIEKYRYVLILTKVEMC